MNVKKNYRKIGNKKDIYIMGGKSPGSPCQYLHWAKGPVQGRTPPQPWEEPSSAMDVVENKGSSLLLGMTLRIIP